MSQANTYIIWANDNKKNINNLDELMSWIEFLNNEAKSKGMPFSVQLQKEENSKYKHKSHEGWAPIIDSTFSGVWL